LDYFLKKGYSLLERNFRCRGGEIDLILRDPDGCLVFVEVKNYSQRSIDTVNPLLKISKKQIKSIVRSITIYISKSGHSLTNKYTSENRFNGDVRLDIVIICVTKIFHFPNISW